MTSKQFKAGEIVKYTNPTNEHEERVRFVVTEDAYEDRAYVYIKAINSTLPSPLAIVPVECVGKEHVERAPVSESSK
ncbi:MAG: hypothetical protein QOG23_1378 [Blastocatellia bacterium]|jgi:hypothetical protein|nr:hypothetical protein [Blastocatellia bacterium]